MTLIDLNNVHRAFPTTEGWSDALCGVNLQMEPGEVVGLLGRNGAGKTTLIHLILGIYPPNQGQVRVFGLDPREHPVEVKRRVGYVAEKQNLPETVTLDRVVEFHRNLFSDWDDDFAEELIESFALRGKQRIGDMSKGQAQQAALVCAIAHRPELLVLDEPAAGLDPATRRQFLETTIRLLGENAPAILFSSHHMNDVERLAQRVVVLDSGKVLLDERIEHLQEEYCLVMLGSDSRATATDLRSLHGCVRVTERAGSLRALFGHGPIQTRALLDRELGAADSLCTLLPLEDLFVELVGDQR